MRIAYFLLFQNRTNPAAAIDERDKSRFIDIVQATPHLEQALIFTPASARDPFLDDGAPPQLAAELYFSDIAALEAAAGPQGQLQGVAVADRFPSLAGAAVSQQAMLVRSFPVPEPRAAAACTYLVAYEGHAQDSNVWLAYYLEHHPPLMARMPGIREIEICTRIDWCGFLPWPRVEHIQRNKTVFDDPAALTAALNSPVRHAMREDFNKFPPFTGNATLSYGDARAPALSAVPCNLGLVRARGTVQ